MTWSIPEAGWSTPSGGGAGWSIPSGVEASGGTCLDLTTPARQQQDDLVLMTATAADGTGTFAWTLTGPDGSDQTGLLSSTTTASVTATPALLSGSGGWVFSCTDGTSTVVQVVQVGGDDGWITVYEVPDFSAEAAHDFLTTPTVTLQGKTVTVENAAQADLLAIDSTGLRFKPKSPGLMGSPWPGTSPVIWWDKTALISDLDSGTNYRLVNKWVETVGPSANGDRVQCGLNAATNEMERLRYFFNIGFLQNSISQVDGGVIRNKDAAQSGVLVHMIEQLGSNSRFYNSTNVGDYDAPENLTFILSAATGKLPATAEIWPGTNQPIWLSIDRSGSATLLDISYLAMKVQVKP